METRLTYHDPDQDQMIRLATELNCSNIFAGLLINRGITTAAKANVFLNPGLDQLKDPFSLKDMDQAVQRIWAAVRNQEKILIFGDFDADGVTATCLLNDFFTHLNADITWYIPHRTKEGYSLQPAHIQLALEMDVDLIITVDCGSSSHEAVALANNEDIDVIITDHHEVNAPYPESIAMVNPKRPDCPSGLNYLAGVGVAFYLAIALRKYLREQRLFEELPEPNLLNFSDLVALGTIGDMVPLVNENRVLCKAGLNIIRNGSRPGIKALSSVSRINYQNIDSDDISFKIVPRINAAGRMSHARICVNHLSSVLPANAQETALVLDQLNLKRQQVEKNIVEAIEHRIAKSPELLDKSTLVLWDDAWEASVLGIAASKLVRKYAKPVILISTASEPAMGSGRSLEGLNILDALTSCTDHLTRFGGHSMAAGLSLDADKLEAFTADFETRVQELTREADLTRTLAIDRVLDMEDITMSLAVEVDQLRPFGVGNPEPLFISRNIRVLSSTIIGTNHRKMVLQDTASPAGRKVDAFHFNLSDPDNQPQLYDQVAYRIKINKFTMKSPQIILEDL